MMTRFCIQNRITDREAIPCTVAHMLEVMDSEHVRTICDQIKLLSNEYPNGGNDYDEQLSRLKRQLPCITPHAKAFKDNIRKNANAIDSGLAMLDVDDVDNPSMDTLGLTPDLCRTHSIYYVGITPSGHGLRLIAERQCMETIPQAQERLYNLLLHLSTHYATTPLQDAVRTTQGAGLGIFDTSTKDLARASFLVPRSYILYLDEQGLSRETTLVNEANQYREATIVSETNQSHETISAASPDGASARGNMNPVKTVKEQGATFWANGTPVFEGLHMDDAKQKAADLTPASPTYQGLEYKQIIEQLVTLLGGEPQIGARNTFYFTLVMYARYITDFNPDRTLAILPDFNLSETERRSVITSAINRPRKSTIPDMITRAIAIAEVNSNNDNAKSDEWPIDQTSLPMPKLPKVLQTICRRLPKEFHPAMVIAALPVLGTLATRVRFKYLDHQEHSFSFMSCITAPAATGKSFIRRPINLLLTPIDEQDAVEREKEQEYKDKLRVAKNAKVQPENPRACPRNNGINISIAKLLQLLSYSEGKHLIGIGEEIDTLVKSEKAGVWSQKSDIYRLGFDNAKYGQNYMSDNSFSANVPVYYNLLLTGTPGGMYRFFKDVEDGLVTRFAFAQLPDMFGTDIPDFQPYNRAEEESIIRTARMLDMASGKIDCPEVDAAISQWLIEKKQLAIESDSRAIDTIRRRAAVIGFRAGYLSALLNGSVKKSASSKPAATIGRIGAPIECRSDRGSRGAAGYRETVGDGRGHRGTAIGADDNYGWLSPDAAFALWVAEYIFRNQMALFGNKFEQVANEQYEMTHTKGSVRSLINQLPTTFTKSELMTLRARKGQSTHVATVLHRWITAGLITQIAPNQYQKGNAYGTA